MKKQKADLETHVLVAELIQFADLCLWAIPGHALSGKTFTTLQKATNALETLKVQQEGKMFEDCRPVPLQYQSIYVNRLTNNVFYKDIHDQRSMVRTLLKQLADHKLFWEELERLVDGEGVEELDTEIEHDPSFCAWLWEQQRKGWVVDATAELIKAGEWYSGLVDKGEIPSSFDDLCKFDWRADKQVEQGLAAAFCIFGLIRSGHIKEATHA